MNDERARRVEALYQQAADLPPEQRAGFLQEQCSSDPALRAEVESLLHHLDLAGDDFMVPPHRAAHQPPAAPAGPAGSVPDEVEIGPYRLIEQLGEGGFGLVYVAEQTAPVRRRVALKLLKAGMDTRAVLARFEAERQALALMEHPNIARVLDAGATGSGRPYFVMELVKGDSLTVYCDRERLGVRQRVELFVPVCQAVQHAHQKGVIHRDLKPSNILVTVVDGRPVPKVIDFGIAKATGTPLTDKTLHTLYGQVMGTPVYMSPEQAELTGIDIDTTSDVYALGVILYELLTGQPPIAHQDLLADGLGGMARILRRIEPQPPSVRVVRGDIEAAQAAALRRSEPLALARELRGDLDWIVVRAIDKDRTRRYQAANLLAQDLERALKDEPVEAGPPSAGYRLRKFARRHRAALSATTAIVLGMLGVAAGLGVALFESNRQRSAVESALHEAQNARQESEAVTLFLSQMLGAAVPEERGRDVTVRQVLDEASATVAQEFASRPLVQAHLRTTIGSTYRQLGFFAEAERHLTRAHAVRDSLLGAEAPATLTSLRELGALRQEQGDYPAAESLLASVRAERTRLLGESDPATLSAQLDVAAVLMLQQRDAEAVPILEATLERARADLGPDHPTTLATMSDLALLHIRTQRYEAGVEVCTRLLELAPRVYGEDHTRTLTARGLLGMAYLGLGRPERAEPILRAALERRRATQPPDHWRVGLALSQHGEALAALGRFEAAEEQLVLGHRILQAGLGPDHAQTRQAAERVRGLYERWRQPDRKARWEATQVANREGGTR
jgi:serine/threonine protein kinase